MRKAQIVRLPTSKDDRARPALVGAIGAACFAAGLALVWQATTSQPPAAADTPAPPRLLVEGRAEPSPAAATPPSPAPAAAPTTPSPSTPPTARVPMPGPTPARAGAIRVTRGRVAYLRCGQVPEPGRPPCPRDRALEEAVWAVIEALPTCGRGPFAAGEADLRVELAPGVAPTARIGPARGIGPALDGPPLLACLRGSIASLPARTEPGTTIVGFRFSVSPGD